MRLASRDTAKVLESTPVESARQRREDYEDVCRGICAVMRTMVCGLAGLRRVALYQR